MSAGGEVVRGKTEAAGRQPLMAPVSTPLVK